MDWESGQGLVSRGHSRLPLPSADLAAFPLLPCRGLASQEMFNDVFFFHFNVCLWERWKQCKVCIFMIKIILLSWEIKTGNKKKKRKSHLAVFTDRQVVSGLLSPTAYRSFNLVGCSQLCIPCFYQWFPRHGCRLSKFCVIFAQFPIRKDGTAGQWFITRYVCPACWT